MNTDIGTIGSPNRIPQPSSISADLHPSPIVSANLSGVGDGEIKSSSNSNIECLPGTQIKIPPPETPANKLDVRITIPADEFSTEVPCRPSTPAGEFDIEIPCRPNTPADEFNTEVPRRPRTPANEFIPRSRSLENLKNEFNVEIQRPRIQADEFIPRAQSLENLKNEFDAEIQRLENLVSEFNAETPCRPRTPADEFNAEIPRPRTPAGE